MSSAPSDSIAELLNLLRMNSSAKVERPDQIFCNRDLNLQEVDAIGFDMDYTLAVYNQREIDRLSVELTVDRLIAHRGHPEEIRQIQPDPEFAIRGLVLDTERGNILKLDSHRHVGMAYHGLRALGEEELAACQREAIRFNGPRYALIDTLYALPEAYLYAALTDFYERKNPQGPHDWRTLYEDIRFSIDLAHRDGSFKKAIMRETERYVVRSPYLALTLHRFRSAGKRLFLLTNSYPEYTHHLMTYLLDGSLAEYGDWRQYFDVVICGARKPDFFTQENAILNVDEPSFEAGKALEGPFLRGKLYLHGNIKDFAARSKLPMERTMYVGDHIYGDILRSRKSSTWRTVMIVQEMQAELERWKELRTQTDAIEMLEAQLVEVTSTLSQEQWLAYNLGSLSKELQDRPQLLAKFAGENIQERLQGQLRFERDILRRKRRALLGQLLEHERQLQTHFNRWWGRIFKMNNKNSVFGEQVQDYACLYTSSVTNFVHYSPLHYFRAPLAPMPHERA